MDAGSTACSGASHTVAQMMEPQGTLLEERPPPTAVLEVVPPLAPQAGTVRQWVWRAVLALAVVLVIAGMLAWSSTPPT
jgi:hypothetical protein